MTASGKFSRSSCVHTANLSSAPEISNSPISDTENENCGNNFEYFGKLVLWTLIFRSGMLKYRATCCEKFVHLYFKICESGRLSQ